jgi:hypothetical protein
VCVHRSGLFFVMCVIPMTQTPTATTVSYSPPDAGLMDVAGYHDDNNSCAHHPGQPR